MRLTKIEYIDLPSKEKINAPTGRMVWYFLSFGLWGERYHYKHVTIRKYFSVPDNRLSIDLRAVDNASRVFAKTVSRINHINCRCTPKRITK